MRVCVCVYMPFLSLFNREGKNIFCYLFSQSFRVLEVTFKNLSVQHNVYTGWIVKTAHKHRSTFSSPVSTEDNTLSMSSVL